VRKILNAQGLLKMEIPKRMKERERKGIRTTQRPACGGQVLRAQSLRREEAPRADMDMAKARIGRVR
jgi:hypothetical protein